MHDWRKQHGPDMVGELGRMLELGNISVRNCVVWLVGKMTCGATTVANDARSRILTSGWFVEFQEGNGCRDRGGTSCVCAFGDVARIRGTSTITRLHSARGGQEQDPPQFRQAPRPGTPFQHDLDAGHPR